MACRRTAEGRRYISYRDLSVQQLGSIYERLLEHEVARDGTGTGTTATRAADDFPRNLPVERRTLTSIRPEPSDVQGSGYADRVMLAASENQHEALNLPAQERIELITELWDSTVPAKVPVLDSGKLIRYRLRVIGESCQ